MIPFGHIRLHDYDLAALVRRCRLTFRLHVREVLGTSSEEDEIASCFGKEDGSGRADTG